MLLSVAEMLLHAVLTSVATWCSDRDMSELRTPTSFAEIITAFGFSTLADLFGTSESHIRVMKARCSIPAEYWGIVIEQAPFHGLGISWNDLKSLRARRFADAEQAS